MATLHSVTRTSPHRHVARRDVLCHANSAWTSVLGGKTMEDGDWTIHELHHSFYQCHRMVVPFRLTDRFHGRVRSIHETHVRSRMDRNE